ncbi:MAG: nucleotidyltransferase substrate binding protein [Deltaproteobacteria bacterium]|nr:nucleotidyltransferase substrate binding protein [Deltaproteobacteria bacterium]
MAPFAQAYGNFTNAVERLRRSSVKNLGDPTIVAGIIMQYVLAFETCWKAMRAYLTEKLGVEALNPRHAIVESYASKIIDDEQTWLDMMKDRNFAVHVYSEQDARELAERITGRYLPELSGLCEKLKR